MHYLQAHRQSLLCLLIVGWCSFGATPAVGQPPSPRTDYLGDPLPEGALFRLGTTRLRHPGASDLLLFADDGKSLIALGWEEFPSAWDVETGKQIKIDATKFELLDKATGKSILARFNPALWSSLGFGRAGNTLLAASPDHVVTAWDIESGKATSKTDESLEDKLPYHNKPAATSAPVRFLDPLTGEEQQKTIRWSYMGRNWSLADRVDQGSGQHLRVHYWSSGEEQKSETRHKLAVPTSEGVAELRITLNIPEKKIAVLAWWEYVGAKDLESGKLIWQKEVGPVNESGRASKQVKVNCLALSPDGKTVAAGTDSGHIDLVDLTTGKPSGGSRLHPGFFSGPAQIVTGGKFLLVPMGREAVLWDLTAGRRVRSFGSDSGEDLHVASPDGESLLVAYYKDDRYQVSLEETVTGKKLWELDHRYRTSPDAQFSQDGQIINIEGVYLSAKTGKQLAAADVKDAQFPVDEKQVRHRAGVKDWHAAVSPDGRLIANYVWEEKSGMEPSRVASHFEVRDVQSKETVLKLEKGPPSRVLSMRTGPVGCFSADSKIFAYRSGDSIRFYDLETKQPLGPARPHPAPIWDMTFAPSGYTLAAYCNDSTVIVWDAKATAR